MLRFLFAGRINRKEYFLGLILSFISIAVVGIGSGIIVKAIFQEAQWVANVAGEIFFVCIVLLSVKRLHDIGRSGWWALLFFPFAPFIILYLMIVEGHSADNQYGTAPANRRFSLFEIFFNTSSPTEVTPAQEPIIPKSSSSSNRIAIMSVLAVSPLGALLPLYWFSVMGWCRIAISFGESTCAIPVVGGYFAGVQEWFAVVNIATLGLGSIVWFLGAIAVWALLCISLIMAVHQSGRTR